MRYTVLQLECTVATSSVSDFLIKVETPLIKMKTILKKKMKEKYEREKYESQK